MLYNLMAEIVKAGVPPTLVAKKVAEVISCTEKTARNKLQGKTDFSIPEAVAINKVMFQNRQSIEYLFADDSTDPKVG